MGYQYRKKLISLLYYKEQVLTSQWNLEVQYFGASQDIYKVKDILLLIAILTNKKEARYKPVFFWIQEAAYSTSENAFSTYLLDITNVHIHQCTLYMEEILKYYKNLVDKWLAQLTAIKVLA